MNGAELFACFYFGCGLLAVLLPSGKNNEKPIGLLGALMLVTWGPLALWVAWSTRTENLRREAARREVEEETRRNRERLG